MYESEFLDICPVSKGDVTIFVTRLSQLFLFYCICFLFFFFYVLIAKHSMQNMRKEALFLSSKIKKNLLSRSQNIQQNIQIQMFL